MSLPNLSADLTELLLPWITILVSIVVAIMFKDFAASLAKGIAFKLDRTFKEGDKVLLDDVESTIIKIGARTTIFGYVNDNGYVWRYVPNERIRFLKLEKIIDVNLRKEV